MSMSHEIGANYDQMDLLPQSVEEWVPEDHPARFIREFVDALDLGEVGFGERKSEEGRPSYANDLLLKVWLHGHLARIRSTRELERACREHLSLVWLTGRHAPDHNTLWRFWGENRAALREVFRAGVRVAGAQGLIGMICHAVDGTKIRAVASRRTVEHRKELEKALGRVQASIAEMEAAEETGTGEGSKRAPNAPRCCGNARSDTTRPNRHRCDTAKSSSSRCSPPSNKPWAFVAGPCGDWEMSAPSGPCCAGRST
jgi:transposase